MASVFGFGSEVLGDGRPVHRTRTWNDNGTQYTQNERAYNGSNTAFSTVRRRAGAPFVEDDPARTSRNRGGSLLGRVVNGITDYVSSNTQHDGKAKDRERRRPSHIEDMAYGDDYGQSRRTSGRSQRQYSQGQPRYAGRGFASNNRSAFVGDYVSSDESDVDEWNDDVKAGGAAGNAELLAALENAAEYHRREARLARKHLEQACRQTAGNAPLLQNLSQKVEGHEKARERALRDLKYARKDEERLQGEQRERRTSRRRRPSQRESIIDDFDNDPFFNDPFFDAFHNLSQQRGTQSPFAQQAGMGSGPDFGVSPFAAFENFFADVHRVNRMHHDMHQQFFEMPGASFTASFSTRPRTTRSSTAPNSRPQYRQSTSFTTAPPQPQARSPPATFLKPEEAQRLFASYNERWNTVSPADPNIPFPARGLKPTNLIIRNTLWAPLVSSPIEVWSEETVMKANTQAFFLGAVGLRPAYTELAGAKIELGIDKSAASAAQLQQLIDDLKKERIRWHSDRLGKRNGGRSGPNAVLQNDERARAVYHGVCELIEAAL